ncbi:hypothetical protein E4K64_39820 [Bradyrhizobium frederickii]|uniref:Uncharacterized protein n=1 Tax=Bradyrhizobium frederickii TaxID=2560054 RepID=A0A4Y9KMS3_9BRAD|nr:hypothetical protein E4K66_40175 [Bradyrhizobium frederickii]TFV65868.1 hypothetical protein E4K64_39820 [Bradyrhizobium frederickii]
MSRQAFWMMGCVPSVRRARGQKGPTGVIDAMDQDRPQHKVFGSVRGEKPRPDEKPKLHDGVEAHAPRCPLSDDLRLIRRSAKGGSGSSGVRV